MMSPELAPDLAKASTASTDDADNEVAMFSSSQHRDHRVEMLLSEKLMNGYTLLSSSCPSCSTPLVKKDANEDDNAPRQSLMVEPSKFPLVVCSQSFEKPFSPVDGVPFCVLCYAHVITSDVEVALLEGSDSFREKGSILVALGSSSEEEYEGEGEEYSPSGEDSGENEYYDHTVALSDVMKESKSILDRSPLKGVDPNRFSTALFCGTTASRQMVSESPVQDDDDEEMVEDLRQNHYFVTQNQDGEGVEHLYESAFSESLEEDEEEENQMEGEFEGADEEQEFGADEEQEFEADTEQEFEADTEQEFDADGEQEFDADGEQEFDADGEQEFEDENRDEEYYGNNEYARQIDLISDLRNSQSVESAGEVAKSFSKSYSEDERDEMYYRRSVVQEVEFEDPEEGESQDQEEGFEDPEEEESQNQEEESDSEDPEKMMIEYSVRREIATKVLGTKLLEGYSLRDAQCTKCGMPVMERDRVVECVVCPILMESSMLDKTTSGFSPKKHDIEQRWKDEASAAEIAAAEREASQRAASERSAAAAERAATIAKQEAAEKAAAAAQREASERAAAELAVTEAAERAAAERAAASERAAAAAEESKRLLQEARCAADEAQAQMEALILSYEIGSHSMSEEDKLDEARSYADMKLLKEMDAVEAARKAEEERLAQEARLECEAIAKECARAAEEELQAAAKEAMKEQLRLELQTEQAMHEAKCMHKERQAMTKNDNDEIVKAEGSKIFLEMEEVIPVVHKERKAMTKNDKDEIVKAEGCKIFLEMEEVIPVVDQTFTDATRLQGDSGEQIPSDKEGLVCEANVAEDTLTDNTRKLEDYEKAEDELKKAEAAIAHADFAVSKARDHSSKAIALNESVTDLVDIGSEIRNLKEQDALKLTPEDIEKERWASLRAEGRSALTRKMMQGWQLNDDLCLGKHCRHSPIVEKNGKSECVVCGGTGDGKDGVYEATHDEIRLVSSSMEPAGPNESNSIKITTSPLRNANMEELKGDFEAKRALVSKEIGKRMIEGWTLLDFSCPYCVMPLMRDGQGGSEECVLCGPVDVCIEEDQEPVVQSKIETRETRVAPSPESFHSRRSDPPASVRKSNGVERIDPPESSENSSPTHGRILIEDTKSKSITSRSCSNQVKSQDSMPPEVKASQRANMFDVPDGVDVDDDLMSILMAAAANENPATDHFDKNPVCLGNLEMSLNEGHEQIKSSPEGSNHPTSSDVEKKLDRDPPRTPVMRDHSSGEMVATQKSGSMKSRSASPFQAPTSPTKQLPPRPSSVMRNQSPHTGMSQRQGRKMVSSSPSRRGPPRPDEDNSRASRVSRSRSRSMSPSPSSRGVSIDLSGRDDVSLMSEGVTSRAESVASAALDIIYSRIESCKEQLLADSGDITKQLELANLIEKLASAAVAMKKLEDSQF